MYHTQLCTLWGPVYTHVKSLQPTVYGPSPQGMYSILVRSHFDPDGSIHPRYDTFMMVNVTKRLASIAQQLPFAHVIKSSLQLISYIYSYIYIGFMWLAQSSGACNLLCRNIFCALVRKLRVIDKWKTKGYQTKGKQKDIINNYNIFPFLGK